MQEGVLLHETRERNSLRQNLPGIVNVPPGQAVFRGLVMINSREQLRAVIDSRQDVRRGGELDQSAVGAGLRIDSQCDRKWRGRASQPAEGAQI